LPKDPDPSPSAGAAGVSSPRADAARHAARHAAEHATEHADDVNLRRAALPHRADTG